MEDEVVVNILEETIQNNIEEQPTYASIMDLIKGESVVSITLGNTYTLAPGEQAYVVNRGSEMEALIDFYLPAGEQGLQGVAGREIQLQKTLTHIQWRYVGDSDWINLLSLADVKGEKGDTGLPGADGYTPVKGVDYFDGQDGEDGYTPIKNTDYFDGEDGREVEFQKSSTHIQWRYVGDVSWTNLIPLTEIKGEQGIQGNPGVQGIPGTNGLDGSDGTDGRGISSIIKISTVGLIDTYRITYTDSTTSTFIVTNGQNGTNGTNGTDGLDGTDGLNGSGIASIVKTGTVGLVDTYTITYDDASTSTFDITNGADGSAGQDGYTPYIQDGYWYVNGVSTGILARGEKGDKGDPGETGAAGTTDHGTLTGLGDLDHPASAIMATTTNFDKKLSSADDTVQKALETLDEHEHSYNNLSDKPTIPTKLEIPQFNIPRRSAAGNGEVDDYLEYSSIVSASTIVRRSSSSTIRAAAPTADDELTPKSYVDTKVAKATRAVHIQLVADATDVDTTSGVAYFNVPQAMNGMNLTRAIAYVTTAGTTNATTVQIRNMTKYASNDALSAAISIAGGGTVGTAGTVNASYDDVSTNDLIKIYVTGQSTTKPKGLRVVLEYQLP